MSLRSRIVTIVNLRPGLSAPEIAVALGRAGDASITAQVGQLEAKKELRREGLGKPGAPYRYYVRKD